MHPELKVYLDRLHGGRVEVIKQELPSDFLEVDEPDLKFCGIISIKGKAYLADEHLVVQLEIKVEVVIPCAICNKQVHKKLKVPQFYHTEELSGIKGKVYNYTDPLREGILLETPSFAECENGCLKRKELEKYEPSKEKDDNVQFPFTDLK